ncbi:hypothetical protein VTJ04DRAFT_8912 [Mycothermus thermophilus]|uniref:uncharacterized protein n=1 Tax=Humicola insolens TaxID=85995 RepID=UPI0037449069
MADAPADPYQDWSRDRLLERVRELEQQLKAQQQQQEQEQQQATTSQNKHKRPAQQQQQQQQQQQGGPTPSSTAANKKKKKPARIDPSKYSTRYVALKLAYLGKRYGGFEYQATSPLPTIEGELWRALVRSCLIWPDDPDKVDFSPWEYSKCGRTDRGVSAFGQVITIRLRSNRPVNRPENQVEGDEAQGGDDGKPAWDPIADEINYPRVLNRLLPDDIRVLAWAPTLPAGFNARFSCRERQYRYYFTQPAFSPFPGAVHPQGKPGHEGWLDIAAMREAAKLFEGAHDFRNVCKVDGTKQITNFTRRVFEADIVEVDGAASALPYVLQQDFRPEGMAPFGTYPKVYYFLVRGSAFLWHQIRHMVSILFLVGQGLEKPSVVTELLDITRNPRKPNYQMADEVPLVLWDCIFPLKGGSGGGGSSDGEDDPEAHDPDAEVDLNMKDAVDWVWVGEDKPTFLYGGNGLVDQLWETWRERKMDELLAAQLLNMFVQKPDINRRLAESQGPDKLLGGQRIFEGGNSSRSGGSYVPVMKRQLMPSPQEVNDKWAQSKGFANAEELAKTKNWRSVIKANKEAAAASNVEDQ